MELTYSEWERLSASDREYWKAVYKDRVVFRGSHLLMICIFMVLMYMTAMFMLLLVVVWKSLVLDTSLLTTLVPNYFRALTQYIYLFMGAYILVVVFDLAIYIKYRRWLKATINKPQNIFIKGIKDAFSSFCKDKKAKI